VSLPNRHREGQPIHMTVTATGKVSRRKYGVCVLLEEMVFD
jgi:hypothetical protein